MAFTAPPYRPSAPLKKVDGVLLAYQRRWMGDPIRIRIANKSRRIGITWTEALDAVLRTAAKGAQNFFYQGYNLEVGRLFLTDCKDHVKRLHNVIAPITLNDPDDSDNKAYSMAFHSGAEIVAKAAMARNARGTGRPNERILLDECRDHKEFAASVEAVMAVAVWGTPFAFISSAAQPANEWTQFLEDVRREKYGKLGQDISMHTITWDDAIADGLYRRRCEVLKQRWTRQGEEAFYHAIIKKQSNPAQELFCIPTTDEGAWITAESLRDCVDANLPAPRRWAPPPSWPTLSPEGKAGEMRRHIATAFLPTLPKIHARWWLGVDFARSGDKSVFALARLGADLRLHFHLIEFANCEHHAQDAAAQEIINHILKHGAFAGAAFDARGNGSALAEAIQLRYGKNRVSAVQTSIKWYMDNMPHLRRKIEDASIRIPQDQDTTEDLLQIEMQNGVARIGGDRRTGQDGRQRHGDSAIALAMAVSAYQQTPNADWTTAVTAPRAQPSIRGYTSAARAQCPMPPIARPPAGAGPFADYV